MTSTPSTQPDSPLTPFVQVNDPNGQNIGAYRLTAAGLRVGSWAEGCRIALSGPTIARTHLLVRWDQGQASVLVLSSRYETRQRGALLQPNLTYAWELGQPIELGGYQLVLTETPSQPAQAAAPKPAQAALPALAQEVTGPFGIRINPPGEQLRITPGRTETISVTVRNRGRTPEKVFLSVGRIPEEWCIFVKSEIALDAGAEETIEIKVNVPRDPKNVPGPRPMEIRVQSIEDADAYSSLRLDWTLNSFVSAPRLTLDPRQQIVSTIPLQIFGERLSRATARYSIRIENLSGEAGYYSLNVTGEDPRLNYALNPAQVLINPGQAEYVALTVMPVVPRLDEDRRVSAFTVRLDSDNQPAPDPAYGRFEQVAPGIMARMLALRAATALLLLALLFGSSYLYRQILPLFTPGSATTQPSSDARVATGVISSTTELSPTLDPSVVAANFSQAVAAAAQDQVAAAAIIANQTSTAMAQQFAPIASTVADANARLDSLAASAQADVQKARDAVGTQTAVQRDAVAQTAAQATLNTRIAGEGGAQKTALAATQSALARTAQAPTGTPPPTYTPYPTLTPAPTPTATPTVIIAEAKNLIFGTTPRDIVAGNVISPVITVLLVDKDGQIVPISNVPVTLQLATSDKPDEALSDTLLGQTTVQALNGTARFTNITIQQAGTYVLKTTAAGLEAPEHTDSFNVKAGPATKLVFDVSPGKEPDCSAITFDIPFTVVVNATDAFGNIDTSYNKTIDTSTDAFTLRPSNTKHPDTVSNSKFIDGILRTDLTFNTLPDSGPDEYRLALSVPSPVDSTPPIEGISDPFDFEQLSMEFLDIKTPITSKIVNNEYQLTFSSDIKVKVTYGKGCTVANGQVTMSAIKSQSVPSVSFASTLKDPIKTDEKGIANFGKTLSFTIPTPPPDPLLPLAGNFVLVAGSGGVEVESSGFDVPSP